jgi:hypothetical protein
MRREDLKGVQTLMDPLSTRTDKAVSHYFKLAPPKKPRKVKLKQIVPAHVVTDVDKDESADKPIEKVAPIIDKPVPAKILQIINEKPSSKILQIVNDKQTKVDPTNKNSIIAVHNEKVDHTTRGSNINLAE